jgi:hypothetical protein
VCKWGSSGNGEGQFWSPVGIAVGVCDGLNKSLLTEMTTVPELYAFPPGVLPICVAYIGEECVYVCDEFNERVQMFQCNGTFIRQWMLQGERGIYSVCCKFDRLEGLLYIGFQTKSFQVFDCNGVFIRKWIPDELSVEEEITSFAVSDAVLHCCVTNDAAGSPWVRSYTRNGSLFALRECCGYSPHPIMVSRGIMYIGSYHRNISQITAYKLEEKRIPYEWIKTQDAFVNECVDMAAASNGDVYIVDRNDHKIVVMRPFE